MPIRHRIAPLAGRRCLHPASCGIRRDFSRLSLCDGQVAYVLLTRAPVAGSLKQASNPAAPRLACVKPVASVHPEPGSNSSLLFIYFFFFFYLRRTRQTLFVPFVCSVVTAAGLFNLTADVTTSRTPTFYRLSSLSYQELTKSIMIEK